MHPLKSVQLLGCISKVPRAFLVPLVRKYLLAKPIRYLSEAARKVAAGDFTVQLAPIRTDGQKDEFEVLIDDFYTMTAELASSEMLKNDFISTVSHEFKTPLSVIQNYATMLQSDGISEDERREYTEKISDAARRLTVLMGCTVSVSSHPNEGSEFTVRIPLTQS